MIIKANIEKFVNENLEKDFFLVDITISKNNKIVVLIDSMEGAGINDCVKISRKVENNLDREKDDFELEVSTPGLDCEFRVKEQYLKNLNKEVQVFTKNEKKTKGILKSFKGEKIIVEEKKRIKIEGKKKKQLVVNELEFDLNDIRFCKPVIMFK
jgi:ribosome maturation factor RimP